MFYRTTSPPPKSDISYCRKHIKFWTSKKILFFMTYFLWLIFLKLHIAVSVQKE